MNATRNAVLGLAAFAAASAAAGPWDEALPGMSSDDQLALVRTINHALTNYAASTREKTIEAVYKINRDMVKSVSAFDRKAVLAEVFATVPADALPTVADGFARELFCRKAAGFRQDDDSFADFSVSAMLRIFRRCRDLDLTGQRRTVFAAIMLLKASEGVPPDLQTQLAAFIPESVRDQALDVWIPAALGEAGEKGTYKPLVEARTNDVAVSKAELVPDQVRVQMRWPASEQGAALVNDQRDRGYSKSLFAPVFSDRHDGIGNDDIDLFVMPWGRFAGDKPRRPPPEPRPYNGQCGCR